MSCKIKSNQFSYVSDEVQHGFPHFRITNQPKNLQNIVAKSLLKEFKGREMIDVSKLKYKYTMFRRKIWALLWRKILPFFSRTLANEANIGKKLKKLLNETRDPRKQISIVPFLSNGSTGRQIKKIQRDEDNDEDDDNDSLENKKYHSKSSKKLDFDSIFGQIVKDFIIVKMLLLLYSILKYYGATNIYFYEL